MTESTPLSVSVQSKIYGVPHIMQRVRWEIERSNPISLWWLDLLKDIAVNPEPALRGSRLVGIRYFRFVRISNADTHNLRKALLTVKWNPLRRNPVL